MIELRSLAAIRSRHASREQSHVEPKSPQQCGEGAVQFVAESTAAKGDNFVQDYHLVKPDVSAEGNIEVLERNRHQVGTVESAQSLSVRFCRTEVFDASKIRRNIDHVFAPRIFLDRGNQITWTNSNAIRSRAHASAFAGRHNIALSSPAMREAAPQSPQVHPDRIADEWPRTRRAPPSRSPTFLAGPCHRSP